MVPGREAVMIFWGISVTIQVRMKGGTLDTQEHKRATEAVPREFLKNYHVHPIGPSTTLSVTPFCSFFMAE